MVVKFYNASLRSRPEIDAINKIEIPSDNSEREPLSLVVNITAYTLTSPQNTEEPYFNPPLFILLSEAILQPQHLL